MPFLIRDVSDGAFENVGQITPLFTGKPKRNLGSRCANFPICWKGNGYVTAKLLILQIQYFISFLLLPTEWFCLMD